MSPPSNFRNRTQGRDEVEASKALAWGTKFKGVPQITVIKINNILMPYF